MTLHELFDEPSALTIGIEEELVLLDPETLDLVPRAAEVLARLGDEERFKPELPAAHLEIVTRPHTRVADAIDELAAGRRAVAAAAAGIARPAAATVHPFAAPEGPLTPGDRYAAIEAEYGPVARRQLVCALQVHVGVRPSERALGVYHGLRCHLPELAALAAAAPFYAGRDTGLASVRPLIAGLLPRHGVPPAFSGWEDYAAELAWGAVSGAVPEPGRWWWELRPQPAFGTLEVRVADVQPTTAGAAAIASVVHSLAAALAARHDAGERFPAIPAWRIEENRWAAARGGVEGELADLVTGERRPTRERLHALLDELAPHARRLGCSEGLASARALVADNAAMRLRAAAAAGGGARAIAEHLADAFLDAASG